MIVSKLLDSRIFIVWLIKCGLFIIRYFHTAISCTKCSLSLVRLAVIPSTLLGNVVMATVFYLWAIFILVA